MILVDAVSRADKMGLCTVRLETISKSTPAKMDKRIQSALEASAGKHVPDQFTRMPSGAGHDAQIISRHLPSGMMFVPSIGGISHHWTENTSDEDIVTGARVYADAVAALLKA